MYRGESMSQVIERLRLEVSRIVRHRWTTEERERVRIDQNGTCKECDAPLVAATFHLDHIKPLSQGGEDSLENIQALCVCCHGEKSERERLGAVYAKSLYSSLSRDVMEGLFDAPKPRQLVFGDGEERCVEVDTIGCRVNALIKGDVPLPIANVTDTFKPYDPSGLLLD